MFMPLKDMQLPLMQPQKYLESTWAHREQNIENRTHLDIAHTHTHTHTSACVSKPCKVTFRSSWSCKCNLSFSPTPVLEQIAWNERGMRSRSKQMLEWLSTHHETSVGKREIEREREKRKEREESRNRKKEEEGKQDFSGFMCRTFEIKCEGPDWKAG